MDKKLQDIIEELKKDDVPPRRLSEILQRLSSESGQRTYLLIEILKEKPMLWTQLRQGVKSDTQADREWERTKPGQAEMLIRLEMKMIDRMSSAVRTRIGVLSGEAMGYY